MQVIKPLEFLMVVTGFRYVEDSKPSNLSWFGCINIKINLSIC